MPSTHFSKGSEWRRWDLHVHSPESILHSQFGSDWDKYVYELFKRAIANNISAIGITDYFFIDGYKKLRNEYLNNEARMRQLFANELEGDPMFLDKVSKILILPNIEFRIEKLIPTNKDEPGSERRLTLHVLFSDDVPIEDIEENFINQLTFPNDAMPGAPDERLSLSKRNLAQLGESLQQRQVEFQSHPNPLYTGCMVAMVNDEQISQILHSARSKFGGKYLIILAEEYITKAKWNSSAHQGRKILYQKSHMIFSSNPKTIQETVKQNFAEEFHGAKPCIWGSDAHEYERMFSPLAKGRFCWIKADTTFYGLKQVINEPVDRIFIGECPTDVDNIRQYRRVFITNLVFEKNAGSIVTERWFDGAAIQFNPGMVTIIGNKGSGKSALADTLALLGNCHLSQDSYSFLRPERFKHVDAEFKTSRAGEFTAHMKWYAGESVSRNLAAPFQQSEIERVRYLPQGYLEKLCNPEHESQQQEFQNELERVIFSHVPLPKRLRETTLHDLVKIRTEEIRRAQSALKSRIRAANNKILSIEPKITEAAVSMLQERIKAKYHEIALFDGSKPTEIPPPSQSPSGADAAAAQMAKIDELSTNLNKLREQQAQVQKETAKAMAQCEKAQKARERLVRFEQWVSSLMTEMSADLNECGIDINNIIHVKVDKEPIEIFITDTKGLIDKNERLENANNEDGFNAQQSMIHGEIEKLRAALDGPNQHHQRYLAELERWVLRRAELVGSSEIPNTLAYYEAQLKDAEDNLPVELDNIISERRQLIMQLHQEILREAEVLREYYAPVLEYIEQQRREDPLCALQNVQITFDVDIDGTKLLDEFLMMINNAVSGTFSGAEGRKTLMDLMPEGTFLDSRSTADFVDQVIDSLQNNKKADARWTQNHNIERQLRKSFSTEKMLNLLCQLEYIEFRTSLKFDGKNLMELSPGERGLLLLVFYLLLDKDDCPLIIDQPEENLDNQSIKRVLVPCIKDAKQRRQLFVVTHNPNIAVVCDSEQVIYSSMKKSEGCEIEYQGGSLENPEINEHIVDILEGTLPAFDNRTRKYRTAGAALAG